MDVQLPQLLGSLGLHQPGNPLLVPAFDFADPYYGGTSLKITGDLNATNDIRLYQTSLDVAASTSLQLIHKRGTTGATAMQVGIAFEDAPSTFVYLDVGNSATTGWNTTSFPLAAYAGRKIVVISLRFAHASTFTGCSMKLGGLSVFDGAPTVPAAPGNVVVEALNSIDSNTMSLRLKWTASPDPLRQYNVYVRHLNNTRIWVGACLNNVYYLPIVRRINNEATFKMEVEAVSPTFGNSGAAVSADIVVPPTPPLTAPFITSYAPFTGATVIGTSGDWNSLGTSTRDKAFDNNVSTFFNTLDADASTAWCGLDLGVGNGREARAVSFYPRSTLASRLVGGRFEGSNVADFSSGVTLLATVTVTPQEGAYTTLPLNNPGVFRYFRYLTPGGGFCNVAEVKFYGPPNFSGSAMTWDSGNISNGATINPAAGLWNTLAENMPWNGGTSNYKWVSGIQANFAGADGSYAITVADAITATNLNFTNSGYTLSAASARNITLTGSLLVASGKSATIGNLVSVLYTSNATVNINTGGIVSHDSTNNRIEIGYLGHRSCHGQPIRRHHRHRGHDRGEFRFHRGEHRSRQFPSQRRHPVHPEDQQAGNRSRGIRRFQFQRRHAQGEDQQRHLHDRSRRREHPQWRRADRHQRIRRLHRPTPAPQHAAGRECQGRRPHQIWKRNPHARHS